MKSRLCKLVQEFTYATELPEKPFARHPILLSEDKVAFITKMVADEMEELAEASTIADQADALVDAIYYICDTASRHGIDLDPIFDIVHKKNMEKVGPDGLVVRDTDPKSPRFGKILKPEGWTPPDQEIAEQINNQQHLSRLKKTDFGNVIDALKAGKRARRLGMQGYIFMQIPAEISPDIVPKMTSLPESVKEDFIERGIGPDYRNQIAYQQFGIVEGCSLSSADILATDWIIL